jgi:hypothetical protein
VRFQVLTAAGMKMTAFWDIAPCHHSFLMIEVVSTSKTSVDFYETIRHFFPRVVIIRAMMEALRTSETPVYFSETTRRYIPEGYLPSGKNAVLPNTQN